MKSNQNQQPNKDSSLVQSVKNRKKISDNVVEFTFLGYNTLIMVNTIENENKEGYKYFEGYINMTKFRSDFTA